MFANLHDICIIIDFIMLCETFLSDLNQIMFPLPGNHFVSYNITWCKGGFAMYIRESFQYKIRDDLTMNINNERESIFIEIDQSFHKLVIGEIYRVPGTNSHFSLQ